MWRTVLGKDSYCTSRRSRVYGVTMDLVFKNQHNLETLQNDERIRQSLINEFGKSCGAPPCLLRDTPHEVGGFIQNYLYQVIKTTKLAIRKSTVKSHSHLRHERQIFY